MTQVQMQGIATALGVALVVVLIWWGWGRLGSTPTTATTTPLAMSSPEAMSTPNPSPVQKKFSRVPGVETRYLNTIYHFSFELPDGFLAQEYKTNVPGAQAVIIYNQKGDGLEILIIPTTEKLSTPANAEPVALPGRVTGFIFDSNNSIWNGAGRELWFIYKGYRYELSTSRADAELLDFVYKSWSWR